MKPPISYYGGKQRMAHNIIPLIPKHTVYVEPFAGGAAVFFGKPWPNVKSQSHYNEVINDNDHRIVNFYKQLRDNGSELIRRLSLIPFSEYEYQVSKELNHDDPIESAVRYYVNTQQSFAHKLNGGWRRAKCGTNEAMKWATKIERLPQYLDRMTGVHIACADAIKIIKDWDSPQTFFYCDPPYPGTSCGHYKGYSENDLQKLINSLNECQGSFILSNYDQPNIEFPENWERIEFNASMSVKIGERENRTEVIWRRMAQTTPRKEIIDLYNSGMFDCFRG